MKTTIVQITKIGNTENGIESLATGHSVLCVIDRDAFEPRAGIPFTAFRVETNDGGGSYREHPGMFVSSTVKDIQTESEDPLRLRITTNNSIYEVVELENEAQQD